MNSVRTCWAVLKYIMSVLVTAKVEKTHIAEILKRNNAETSANICHQGKHKMLKTQNNL
jgi:hypothetical protein